MKHVEQIKSILLTFLVLLSVTLTLLIWNYKPDYELIEETEIEEVLVGAPKQLQDVVKPYRVLFRENDVFTGTVSNAVINDLYSNLTSMQVHDIDLINNNLSNAKMNEILRTNNRITLFFNEEIPLKVFSNILTFYEKDIPDAAFTKLLVDWSALEEKNQLQLLFLNTEKRFLFRSYVDVENASQFLTQINQPANEYTPYSEVDRGSALSLYVAQGPIEATKYTYLIEELSPETFKNIVFTDPNIVVAQRKVKNEDTEKYTDDTSLMTVDTKNRILNYVYPLAESITPIPSSELLLDSFEYVNDHGGFTADFRFFSMNIDKHVTDYQLFLQGYPVFSKMTSTRITTTWGENRLFRYRRPYYTIESESDIPNERTTQKLASGEEVVEYVRNLEDYPFNKVDEIVVGYYLTQNPKSYILEPSWFAITNNSWRQITPEQLGGAMNGLE